MKHEIAKQLNEVARTMPRVFEWYLEPTIVEGSWLMHSPIAERQRIEPDKMYTIDLPVLRALDHKQQLKDAYKRGGFAAVKEYHSSVLAKIKMKPNDVNTSS